MVGNKVKYTCKNCGWLTEIREEWADLRPKRCMNRKCNTSFLKYPDALVVDVPIKEEAVPYMAVVFDDVKPSKKGKKDE